MTGTQPPPSSSRGLQLLTVTAALLLTGLPVASAPETVRVTLPAAVGFAVTNVGANTAGSPSTTTMSYSGLNLSNGHEIRISVKADSDFIPPSGASIPASRVSWTTSGAANGIGSNGVLSTSAYGPLFQSTNSKRTGSVKISWTLAAPGTPLRAGTHTLIARWKLESIVP